MPEAKTYPDICVLVDLGQVQHVVQCQHPRRSLGEVHGWVHMVLHLKQKFTFHSIPFMQLIN